MSRVNVRTGLVIGLLMATMYSAYAVILFLLRGQEPFSKQETTIQAVVLTYHVAGAIGGFAVGAMSPLNRSWLGTILVGVCAALLFFFCVAVAREGPFWNWSNAVWESVGSLGTLFGVVLSIMWRGVINR